MHGQWNSHTLARSSTFFTVHGGGKKPHGIPIRTRKGVAGGYEQRAVSVCSVHLLRVACSEATEHIFHTPCKRSSIGVGAGEAMAASCTQK
jgi:hypothetical protein